MSFKPRINQGEIISNNELKEVFACSNMGGMRRSHKTNTLVVVSDHTKSLYDDKWHGEIFHYTGMGKVGNQVLKGNQNLTLKESLSSGVSVHLFEVFSKNKYIYQGEVELSDEVYTEKQIDNEGNLRDVFMFPLRLKSGEPVRVDEGDLEKVNYHREKKLGKVSIEKLKKHVEQLKPKIPTSRKTYSNTHDRDPYVVKYALLRAKGACQLCDSPAPFQKKSGEPYLEVHHIEFLSEGGPDIKENVVALCPNCHKRMHILELKSDVTKLKKLAQEEIG